MTKQPWLRLYRASLHSPKIVTLSDRQHRAWHNCLLMADNDGKLPSMRDIAVHMRMTATDAEQLICELVEAGLVDPVMVGTVRSYQMHDWNEHQQPSDSSASRVKKHRENKRNGECNGDVTLQKRPCNGTDLESDTDKDNLVPSEKPSARERPKVKEQGFKFDIGRMKAKGKADPISTLTKRAEGLGLPVDDIAAETDRAAPKNYAAYFTKLCVTRLRDQVPSLPEEMIRDALWGQSPAAYTTVTAALMGIEVRL